jgi:TPR repeat protein
MGFSAEQIDKGCKHGKTAAEVVEWITKQSANMEEARKQYTEGERWQGGYGEGVDEKKAVDCFRRAAGAGYAPASFALGRCYHHGRGMEKDEAEGAKWCSRAVEEMGLAGLAEEGDPAAQFRLAGAYEIGEGVAKDEAEGVRWYRKAAEQGGAQAQYSLGYAYMTGDGVAKDEAEAVRWRRKAAEQMYAQAQYHLVHGFKTVVCV